MPRRVSSQQGKLSHPFSLRILDKVVRMFRWLNIEELCSDLVTEFENLYSEMPCPSSLFDEVRACACADTLICSFSKLNLRVERKSRNLWRSIRRVCINTSHSVCTLKPVRQPFVFSCWLVVSGSFLSRIYKSV